MNILFVASEVAPFAKTGGLADVTAALPKALARLGHDVRIILPRYREVKAVKGSLTRRQIRTVIQLGSRPLEGALAETAMPGSRVPVYFVEQPALFDRDGLYQTRGVDFPDNLERFSFFSQAVLGLVPQLNWRPEVVHAHDWQTALAITHLRVMKAADPQWRSVAGIFTVHNLAYQGLFPRDAWELTGLPSEMFRVEGLEFYGQINCLKGGLLAADRLSTVSPTYAKEIQTPALGCGLEGVVRGRRGHLVGVLNGIDVEEWNPQTDPHLTARYDATRLEGKARCKTALQRQQRLPQQPVLLIGMIQRLAEQKGIDLFLKAAARLFSLPVQIVMLGTGERSYHDQLTALAKQFPDRLAVNLRFDEALAHQIEAGADAFLMPSRFEPCGLNQMYSLRYGTVPIVHRTGGLADTITDVSEDALITRKATGFVFTDYTAEALVRAVQRAVKRFSQRRTWTQLMRAGMRRDCSWERSAREYVKLYEQALASTC